MTGFDGANGGIGQDGTFRLTVSPGEWLIEAGVMPPSQAAQRPEELLGSVRISAAAGAEENIAIAVGRGAIATGRLVFEGSAAPPPVPSGHVQVPMTYSHDGICRSGFATVTADWTFRVEGMSGTCSALPVAVFGRWVVKAVMFNGDNLLDVPYTFRPGQQLRNVQVILTDKRSDVSVRVTDEHGQVTREYVALLYPVERPARTPSVRTLIGSAFEPMVAVGGERSQWSIDASVPHAARVDARLYVPASTTPSPSMTWSRRIHMIPLCSSASRRAACASR